MKRCVCFGRWLSVVAVGLLPALGWGATFADPHLEAAVRARLGIPTGELTRSNLLALTDLGADAQGITSLSGLEGAVNLMNLSLEDDAVQDLSPLAGLTNLYALFLDRNQVSDAGALAGLHNLHVLRMDANAIQDVSWLGGLTQMEVLSLMANPLNSHTVFGNLHNLTHLYLNGTGMSDVSMLAGLHNLVELGAGENNIHDPSPLANLTQLQFLGLGGNNLGNCAVVANLTNLRTLYLFSDALTDLSPLSGLQNLTWLRLSYNQLRDLTPLAGLRQLHYLDLGWNLVTNGTALNGLTALEQLILTHNLVPDLNFAAGLTAMTNLDASSDRLRDIQGLRTMTSLQAVSINDNRLLVTPGSPSYNVIQGLLARGVAVDYSDQQLPYAATNGTYSGLCYVEGGLASSNSGCITLTVKAGQKYTGKLQLGGKSYSFSGTLAADGTDRKTLLRGKLSALLLDLVLQGSDYLTGTVSAAGESWNADVLAYRAVFDGRSSRSPQLGRYTLVVAGSTNAAALPGGLGYGTLTVDAAGKLRVAGALADGTRFSQSATLGAEGQWPLYTPLYAGKGVVLGWLAFTNDQSFGGALAWSKPGSTAKYYPQGFTWLSQAAGARYTAPGKGTNAFGLSTCALTLTLSGGDLKQELSNQFTLNAKNQVKDLPVASKLSLSITPSSGLFRGRAVDPSSRQGVAFNGVLLQNQTNGCGFFLGGQSSGQVLLSP